MKTVAMMFACVTIFMLYVVSLTGEPKVSLSYGLDDKGCVAIYVMEGANVDKGNYRPVGILGSPPPIVTQIEATCRYPQKEITHEGKVYFFAGYRYNELFVRKRDV